MSRCHIICGIIIFNQILRSFDVSQRKQSWFLRPYERGKKRAYIVLIYIFFIRYYYYLWRKNKFIEVIDTSKWSLNEYNIGLLWDKWKKNQIIFATSNPLNVRPKIPLLPLTISKFFSNRLLFNLSNWIVWIKYF